MPTLRLLSGLKIDQHFSRACHVVELRKPGEDGAIKDMLRDMWYEQRPDTRSKPRPAHVLDLLKKKPAETAVDKALRELQDGPVRDLLRLAFHHGVRGSKPDFHLVPMLLRQNSMNSGPSYSS